jgi:hypothetical protein
MTFSVIAAVGLLELLASLTQGSLPELYFGSFVVPRWPLKQGNPAALARLILGSVQLILELGAAVLACNLARNLCSAEAAGASEVSSVTLRDGLYGRLAVYISLACLAMSVRISLWSGYLDMLDRSGLIRGLVARTSAPARVSNQNQPANLAGPALHEMELQMLTEGALRLTASNQLAQAKETYLKVIAKAEALGRDGEPAATWKASLALALNNLSWLLTTCDDLKLRQPQNALSYARRAVEFFPKEGNYWNTLGVAHFRVGQWEPAKEALKRSMELRGKSQGDSYDWFFLAMIYARYGQKKEARLWYDRAVTWFHERSSDDPELYQFQVEAAFALGLPKPPAPGAAAHQSAGPSTPSADIRHEPSPPRDSTK